MDDYFYFPEPEKNNKKRRHWLLGIILGVFLVGILTFLSFGGMDILRDLFNHNPEEWELTVELSSSQIEVGESFQIFVTLANNGRKNIFVKTIGIPDELVQNAPVTSVAYRDIQQQGDEGETRYDFDLNIAPGGQETIVFGLEALNASEITGNIQVETETNIKTSLFLLTITPQTIVEEDILEDEVAKNELIPYQSVVQITALVNINGQMVNGWTGSGTLISEDGLILTNAHVVLSDRMYDVEDLVVAITQEQDIPPLKMFYADVVQADEDLDLAVIKLRSRLDGSPANFESLAIHPVPLGNSSTLQLGDPLVIIGYPGIGGETITLTVGEVSGFTSEQPYGNRAYIKTSATIAGGNSGGLAVNNEGELIGIPTQLGSGDREVSIVDCRALADTNRDGFINEEDQCVSTGGFINALRPIDLALPMIESAKAGKVAIILSEANMPQEEYNPEGEVILSDDFLDNRNNWGLGEFDEGTVEIFDDQLKISLIVENMVQWSSLPDAYESTILVADGQILNPVGDGEVGFVCGLQDNDNFTVLEFSEDGFYHIWKYEDDEFISLVDWTYSELIDLRSNFSIAAYCGPDYLALAINGTLLAETVDPNYQAGRVGLMVGTWDNPNVVVGYDYFAIVKP